MLTPDRIKEKTFQTTGRGSYRADDVDSFLSEVSASYEQMFRENGDLIKKISILAKKVEEYRADEESLKLALLNAQKLADKIVAEAKETAEKENADVTAQTEKLRADAAAEAEELSAKAKRESDAIIESAKAEAEKIVAEANRQSNEILGNINRKVTHESLVYEMIQKEASEFKGRLVSMYKEHINLINKLPEIVDEQLDNGETEQPEAVEEKPEVVEEIAVAEDVPAEDVAAEPVVEEVIVEEAEEAVEESVSPAAVETEEPSAEEIKVEAEEEPETEPQDAEPVVKKPFKLDLSKIDFADDTDEVPVEEPAYTPIDDEKAADDTDDDDDTKSISFKNFFKKK
ncbi:MAG: DivIVA domain-containing protein [Candidatus Fimenecus sp.]